MILIVLADHHNGETGQCNPAVKRIAKIAGLAERTTENHLQKLARRDFFSIMMVHRADGSRTANQYELNLASPVGQVLDAVDGALATLGSACPAPGGGAADTPGSAPDAEQEPGSKPGSIEPGKEENNNPSDPKKEMWPDWYVVCRSVQGWKTAIEAATAWMNKKGITANLAEEKAYGLQEWWPRRPRPKKSDDPYATWQNWCNRDKRQPMTTKGSSRATRVEPTRTTEELQRGWGKQGVD